jgi:hypothetical protein
MKKKNMGGKRILSHVGNNRVTFEQRKTFDSTWHPNFWLSMTSRS